MSTISSEGPRALPAEFRVPNGLNKRCDLPPEAYIMDLDHTRFPARPGFNTTGQTIKVAVNQFRVTNFANMDVTLYDVNVSPEPKGSIVWKKIWETAEVKNRLNACKHPWIYDGKSLAWSLNKEEIKIKVDLGVEKGSPGKEKDMFLLHVRPSKTIRMEALRAYLANKASWDTSVLECMNFLDHLVRQGPSERFKLIKRSLFSQTARATRLSDLTEAVRGTYSAIRMTETVNSGGLGLAINVDVSNQAFFIGQPMVQVLDCFIRSLGGKFRGGLAEARTHLLPAITPKGEVMRSELFKALRRLHKLRFSLTHIKGDVSYVISEFEFGTQYGKDGANAKTVEFMQRKEDGTEKKISIYDYYMEKYRLKLKYPWLPLIKTSRGNFFPIELCEVKRLTPYPFKLDPTQTASMIKFAVQRPRFRKEHIMEGVADLGWAQDKYLRAFGVTISPQMPMVQAKLLKNPELAFAGGQKKNPGNAGRWDIRGVRFSVPNPQPLKSWAFVSIGGAVDAAALTNFAKAFTNTYRTHGGNIAGPPKILNYTGTVSLPDAVHKAYQETGSAFKLAPQIIFFVVPMGTSWTSAMYERLKKNADCRFGVVSQVILAKNAQKCDPQLLSNVAMKVNAKLGGQTYRLGHWPATGSQFSVPTCMIGVDVSHAGPGSEKPSVASMCLSMDKNACYYTAAVQTNGWRVEVLTPENVRSMLGPMVTRWRQINKTVPQHVFYFRDGVAEGQFAHVLEYELHNIKRVFKEACGTVPKFTVIVATKRHHIRFFPERGDKNDNPLPGTLVEREVTHPFHYDFYLNSHLAIQGTARPVHYNVIHDEVGMKVDALQNLIYHQCYTYCRSTTAVSLHPAVYYAHLASNRARAHEADVASPPQTATVKKDEGGSKKKSATDKGPCPKLLPLASEPNNLGARDAFLASMWYV
ncbi:Piwi domain-containing protein [Echria macrotheca]|uniref:Piwi domain-containing protein n=1 Tax=Echria macrotheca TaxID=438768 RepID=A0AAJ0BFE4_9PEZI|nr:Piwi domain-containing protein [Echria macrotheca]